jgi:hypothetical protein
LTNLLVERAESDLEGRITIFVNPVRVSLEVEQVLDEADLLFLDRRDQTVRVAVGVLEQTSHEVELLFINCIG